MHSLANESRRAAARRTGRDRVLPQVPRDRRPCRSALHHGHTGTSYRWIAGAAEGSSQT